MTMVTRARDANDPLGKRCRTVLLILRTLAGCIALLVGFGAVAYAQDTPSLTITVVDPTGALIVGAAVRIVGSDARASEAVTGQNGTARVELPGQTRVNVHVESAGFEPVDVTNVQVRRDARRTVKLALAKVYETVQVGRDPRERASDPRSDMFATILGAAEIQELPDDPDEMERILKEMAGPGAVMRVNGFRGGRLPPKEQIAQIRFHRNMFAADAHEPGFISVDVITRPGFENWRGQSGFGFRDASMNARNAFAPERADERNGRGSFSASGPLWRKRTSAAVTVDGTNAYDSQTIVAATLAGPFAASIRRPSDALNVSARIEHAMTAAQQLRIEWQRNHSSSDNLGVGNFDLESRAYRQTGTESIVRASLTGGAGKASYNEARLSIRMRDAHAASAVQAPTVSVLNAFTSGGAQIDGARSSTEVEAADDLDISKGRHAVRVGLLVESGRYRTSERRNTIGTFTFADLAAYAALRPTTFTRAIGDATASVTHTQIATYVQDDYRVNRTLTLSGGVRQEFQPTIGGVHLGPRGGITWAPFRSGRTTVRAGAGVFFDWFDADTHLRAVQLDGSHQQVETFLTPAYPSLPQDSGDRRLANGRIELAPDLAQPTLKEASFGVEQALGPVRLNAMVVHRRGDHELRGIDLNAPVAGVRPDPRTGPITQVQSTAASGVDALSINLNVVRPERRLFIAANYTLSRSFNDADTAFSLPADASNPAAERGPALDDARHRAMGFASFPIIGPVSAGVSFTARSALPYDITTGQDNNGDSLSTDRPWGVTRNTGRGHALVDASARLAWRVGFGGPPTQGPSGPQVRIVRRGGDANPLADMPGGDAGRKYGLELYAQVFNAFNHMNALTFSGVRTSPFFGRPVAAAAPRRVELGARLTF